MQKVAMGADRHIIDIGFIFTFFNYTLFHSIISFLPTLELWLKSVRWSNSSSFDALVNSSIAGRRLQCLFLA